MNMKTKLEERCSAVFDGHRCQLAAGHSRKHADYGTDAEPCSVQWTDAGEARHAKDLQLEKLKIISSGID
jgi:hypothetical protein